jgi:hypothetical protein
MGKGEQAPLVLNRGVVPGMVVTGARTWLSTRPVHAAVFWFGDEDMA